MRYADEQARNQDLEKGGLFWKSEKSANVLDPNFYCSWISFTRFVRKLRRNFSESSEIQTFFPPKIRWSPKKKKKKKGLHRDWDWFFDRNWKFQRFFRPKSGGLQIKKKGLHRNWDWFFGRNRNFKRLRGAVFLWGRGAVFLWGRGLFSIFHKKSPSSAPKTCDFAYFTSQWGGSSPPAPPLATLLLTRHYHSTTARNGLRNDLTFWLNIKTEYTRISTSKVLTLLICKLQLRVKLHLN